MENRFAKEWLAKWDKPNFFADPQREGLEEMHQYIQEELRGETVTIEVEFDPIALAEFEKYLASFGWTVEEAANLYLMWCAFAPEKFRDWHIKTNKELIDLAVALYEQKVYSLGHCAAVAGLDKESFIKLLGERQISIYSFVDQEEFKDELKNG